MTVYFYARVSSKEQNLARQLQTAEQFKPDKVFTDKESGKNFERKSYKEMCRDMQKGDTLIVQSLDRLGRNKELVKEELQKFRYRGITVRCLDIPTTMIELPEGSEWLGDMLNNIMIEVIASFAEHERDTIRKRQREGIEAMPVDPHTGKRTSTKTGRPAGRPAVSAEVLTRIREGASYKELGISRSAWYKYSRVAQQTQTAE